MSGLCWQILKTKIIVIGLIVFGCSYASALLEFESLDISSTDFLQQELNECVPTSFLYMMKLGSSELKQAYSEVSGNSDKEKLNTIIEHGLNNQSQITQSTLFNYESGTHRAHFAEWFKSLSDQADLSSSSYQTTMINRLEREQVPGAFVQRIHGEILKSLQHKFPVMLGAELSTLEHKTIDFFYELSHAIVVIGVQKTLSESELGFAIWYLDPTHGEIFSGYIFEELNQPFDARIFDSSESEKWNWSDGKLGATKPNGSFISSPYLRLEAPSIGRDSTLNLGQSRNLFIDTIMSLADE